MEEGRGGRQGKKEQRMFAVNFSKRLPLSSALVSCHCPYFPLSAPFSHFAFSRVIWTLNHTIKTPPSYHLFSILSGEAIGIKQG